MSTSSGPSSSEAPAFGRVTIVGLGVIGGSIARALAAGEPRPALTGWSPEPAERAGALDAGTVDRAPGMLAEALEEADLVVLAVPPEATCRLMGEIGRLAPADATLSDVASLKAPVARAARDAGLADRWVGAHPMAGSEASGFAASRADLFAGARVWLVRDGAAPERAARVEALWTRLGARPAWIDAEAHDGLMARVSHLPQLAATALAAALDGLGVSPEDLGSGGRDMTRLAASNPALWRELFAHARPELAEGLRALAARAEEAARLVDRRDVEGLEALLSAAGAWRRG